MSLCTNMDVLHVRAAAASPCKNDASLVSAVSVYFRELSLRVSAAQHFLRCHSSASRRSRRDRFRSPHSQALWAAQVWNDFLARWLVVYQRRSSGWTCTFQDRHAACGVELALCAHAVLDNWRSILACRLVWTARMVIELASCIACALR